MVVEHNIANLGTVWGQGGHFSSFSDMDENNLQVVTNKIRINYLHPPTYREGIVPAATGRFAVKCMLYTCDTK